MIKSVKEWAIVHSPHLEQFIHHPSISINLHLRQTQLHN